MVLNSDDLVTFVCPTAGTAPCGSAMHSGAVLRMLASFFECRRCSLNASVVHRTLSDEGVPQQLRFDQLALDYFVFFFFFKCDLASL